MSSGVCVTQKQKSNTSDGERLRRQVVCRRASSSAGGYFIKRRFPFLKWSQLEVLCFPRRMRNAFCLSWEDGKKSRRRGGTINGKINRELSLTPQETGSEPKQLGTQRNVIYMRDWMSCLSERLFHCRVKKKCVIVCFISL